MAESDYKPSSSTSNSFFHSPAHLHRYVRQLFVVWLYFACALGSIGTIVGLIAFLIPGKVFWLVLNDKPVETFAEKLFFTVASLFFAIVGTVGLIVRHQRRKAESPKTPN